ncbi:cytochrome p450 [Hirsutella rhossiliensis]|uniref:Cytochrome p450 domain-containing protein n=1 Tax=Hirsutella rhossiliensis TaxID=111463 RepID=A0A9P8MYV1_9HYPO|nr:cytochrome p450 domain-containing protein [Hirsutella rhossiliensis]KAH0962864.1 cytochrome p450 domain-containing protein [Hirsutella rhossiliensis]
MRPTEILSSSLKFLLSKESLPFYFTLGLIFAIARLCDNRHKRRFPEINPKKGFSFTAQSCIQDFVSRSKETLIAARARYRDRPYKLHCDLGELIVVPPRLIHELGNSPKLDFRHVARDDSHAYIPGFDPFDADDRLAYIVMKYLTKALTKLIVSISEETTHALRRVLTDSMEWHEMDPKIDVIRVVSQMSCRVFMGEDLCKNQEWVKVSGDYTLQAFQLGGKLLSWPRQLRPLVHWLMPECWELRARLQKARRVLAPYLEARNALKKEALKSGMAARFDDAIEWFEKEYTGGHDPATCQITLALVAIHTTSDLLVQVMLDLAVHPELIEPLRQEVLELMDSVVKESQRLKPMGLVLLRRLVLEDIELSDGTKFYKGEKLVADTFHMWNSSNYKEGDKYNGYRFLEMREVADQAKHAHLVSTSPNHIGFGHGRHACPGRFFAANEIKIALCHLLLKYDWKLPEGTRPQPVACGMALLPDPTAKLLIRRRKEELDLDSLEC